MRPDALPAGGEARDRVAELQGVIRDLMSEGVVPAPRTADADAWIIAVSDWVPRAELARMRDERDTALRELAAVQPAGGEGDDERDYRNYRDGVTPSDPFVSSVEEGRDAREREEALQRAVDKAHGVMCESAYVGGPSQREAWQTAMKALGEVVTEHRGTDAAVPACEDGGDER